VVLVSDRVITALNRRHLGKDHSTDILAFRLSASCAELIISAETAARNAARYGHSLQREIAVLVVHGILHLKGFDDSHPERACQMGVVQEQVVSGLMRKASQKG